MGFQELKQLSAHVSSLSNKLRLQFDYSKFGDVVEDLDKNRDQVDATIFGRGENLENLEFSKIQNFEDRVEVNWFAHLRMPITLD
jgi:hypothetical protein